ncbi:hypothetical protein CKA32_003892 [Geitlerinema sp. FC II]|nr:hypothetical protein CKA32_003892 [Geitlerinema sp. FC II]
MYNVLNKYYRTKSGNSYPDSLNPELTFAKRRRSFTIGHCKKSGIYRDFDEKSRRLQTL